MTRKVVRSFALHSNKGGVGKTTLVVNFGVELARRGYRVCILDYDLGGPNLYSFFEKVNTKYINEYFTGNATLDECLVDASDEYGLDGALFLGLADPSAKSVEYMLHLDPNGGIQLLQSSFLLKKTMMNKKYDIDYFILDTTPGLSMITLNSFLLIDAIFFIIKISNSDINGTIELITGLIEHMNNQAAIVANNIPAKSIADDDRRVKIEDQIIKKIISKTGFEDISFLGWIPQDEKLQITEFENAIASLEGDDSQRMIHAISQPDHPIMKSINSMIDKLID